MLVSSGVEPDHIVIKLNKRLFLPVNEPYKMVPNESPQIKMEF
jgi:hypothetical protein